MCEFDKTLTAQSATFVAVVIIATIVMFLLLPRMKSRVMTRYLVVATGVLIFEMFTAPMWHNTNLGRFAYVYHDVSWVLTMGWSTLILSIVTLVDHFLPRWSALRRFSVYLVTLTVLVFAAESVVVGIGIRAYAPEVLDALVGVFVAGVPIEGLYYVAVFTSLIIGFYKYWEFEIDREVLVPVVKNWWLGNLLIAAVAVLLFELMIEPMVVNENFPAWSYIYRDITIVMTGTWILLIWLATTVVDRYLIHLGLLGRFAGYLFVVGLIALPVESWFIINGHRVYGESAVANFTGYLTPITNVPAEVSFAIPMYMALIIAFIKYWQIVRDNDK